ncbi:MAG TPA: hypothetical protein VGI92_09740 [Gemmatimonadales bacterium]
MSAGSVFLALLAMLSYRADSHPDVLGLWSRSYAAVLCVACVLTGIWVIRALRARSPDGNSAFLDVGVSLWGIAYALTVLAIPGASARMAELNLVGSPLPAAAVLEWAGVGCMGIWLALRLVSRTPLARTGVALSIATVFAMLWLVEVALRVRATIAPVTQGITTYTSLAWRQRWVRLNESGFRDGTHSIAPHSGRPRLLFIGDSFAFGTGINDPSDRIGERTAGMLDSVTGAPWESINLSAPDRNTLEEFPYATTALA